MYVLGNMLFHVILLKKYMNKEDDLYDSIQIDYWYILRSFRVWLIILIVYVFKYILLIIDYNYSTRCIYL